jgi:hypothetical protein
MSKKQRFKFGTHYTPLSHPMQDSLAWKELDPAASKIYLDFARQVPFEYANYDPARYKYHVALSRNELREKYGFSKTSIGEYLKHLVALGFLDPAEQGGLQGTKKKKNQFFLSRRWEKYGMPDFVEIPYWPAEPGKWPRKKPRLVQKMDYFGPRSEPIGGDR